MRCSVRTAHIIFILFLGQFLVEFIMGVVQFSADFEIIAFAAANKELPKSAKKNTYATPEAEVVDVCMTALKNAKPNIEITHNHPEKEDVANSFDQRCMLEAGFVV